MWFKDQQGRFINSDSLQMVQVLVRDEDWQVCAYEVKDNDILFILYTGSEADCQKWADELVTMINKFKAGVL